MVPTRVALSFGSSELQKPFRPQRRAAEGGASHAESDFIGTISHLFSLGRGFQKMRLTIAVSLDHNSHMGPSSPVTTHNSGRHQFSPSMHRPILRLSLLLMCLLAFGQSARASHCRHVDRLVMAQQAPNFWESNTQPAWEPATADHSATGWSTTCHKPTGSSGQSFVQPIVAVKSTVFEIAPDQTGSSHALLSIYLDSSPEPAPRPRPPRAG